MSYGQFVEGSRQPYFVLSGLLNISHYAQNLLKRWSLHRILGPAFLYDFRYNLGFVVVFKLAEGGTPSFRGDSVHNSRWGAVVEFLQLSGIGNVYC